MGQNALKKSFGIQMPLELNEGIIGAAAVRDSSSLMTAHIYVHINL